MLAQHQHAPASSSGRAVLCPISDPAEITGGVRNLSVLVEQAKVSPATGLAVTATKLDRQLNAGHQLGKTFPAGRQLSEAGGH